MRLFFFERFFRFQTLETPRDHTATRRKGWWSCRVKGCVPRQCRCTRSYEGRAVAVAREVTDPCRSMEGDSSACTHGAKSTKLPPGSRLRNAGERRSVSGESVGNGWYRQSGPGSAGSVNFHRDELREYGTGEEWMSPRKPRASELFHAYEHGHHLVERGGHLQLVKQEKGLR